MNVGIVVDVFIGEKHDFTNLRGEFIGGAELYLHYLIDSVLREFSNHITVYQSMPSPIGAFDGILIRQTRKDLPREIDALDLLLISGLYNPDLRILRKDILSSPAKKLAVHHGMVLNPTVWSTGNLNSYVKYLHRDYGIRKHLVGLAALEFRRYFDILYLNYLSSWFHKTVSVDRHSLSYVYPPLRKNWTVIPNFVDTGLFNPRHRAPVVLDHHPNVLVPRNLSFGRGCFIVPALARRLTRDHLDATFTVTGTGTLKEFIKTEACREHVSRCIRLVGHQDYFSDMPNLYSQCDVVLVPSFSNEGTSLAVLQGMACRKPIVTTNVGGLRDIGVNGIHKLSSNFHCESIYANLKSVLIDGDLRTRIADRGYHYVLANHRLDRWAQAWRNLLSEFIAP